MKKNIGIVLIISILFFSCKQEEKLSANTIINKAIEISGGNIIKNATIKFNFRNKQYTAIRQLGNFKLGRHFIAENDTITDWLFNKGFERTINGKPVKVANNLVPKYAASVNSVHYFSMLPFGLNDKAVNKTYVKDVEIKGETFHKIKVTFNENGGGEDFEDVFMYFINSKTFKVAYLAYSYEEEHGVGLRFREAYNERFVNGVRVVDYNNYKPKSETAKLELLEEAFNKNDLELLSKIELENVEVIAH